MTSRVLFKTTRRFLLMSVAGFVTACAHDQHEPLSFVRAEPTEPPVIEAKVDLASVPVFRQVQKPLTDGGGEEKPVPDGLTAIEQAYRDSIIASAPDGFVNATQYFPYQRGSLFELHATPGFISVVELQPGEKLVNYALGDTARWVVGDVTNGAQTRLFVKPVKADLSTNLVITTDKRVYVVEAKSHKRDAYNAVIAWTYPLEEISTQVEVINIANKENADTIVTGVPIDQLNFDYVIEGDEPNWRPVRAFDDGTKVYIEFPKSLGSSEAPPLFLAGKDGTGQLVNYRVKQNYYVVDRLFDIAELRLADTSVQIAKNRKSSWSRWFASPSKRKSLRRDTDDHGEQHDRADHSGMNGSHRM